MPGALLVFGDAGASGRGSDHDCRLWSRSSQHWSGSYGLWDARSGSPEPTDPAARRFLLSGFAGYAFTGIPVRARAGSVDSDFPEMGLPIDSEVQ